MYVPKKGLHTVRRDSLSRQSLSSSMADSKDKTPEQLEQQKTILDLAEKVCDVIRTPHLMAPSNPGLLDGVFITGGPFAVARELGSFSKYLLYAPSE